MRVIIMGATSGIGQELARMYHKSGHAVGIAGRRLENLKQLSLELSACPYAQIDITCDDAPKKLQSLIERLGGMDLYLHVSGIGKQNRTLECDIELATVNTNVLGFTRMLNHAYHYFAGQRGGHIAVVSSIAGTKGIGVAPSYSATKRFNNTYIEALEQLARINGINIAFTDIRPGFVDTDMLSRDFHYPMMMSVDKVASSIVKGIQKRKRVLTIDWRFRLLVFFWRLLPSSIWVRLRVA
ncbi:MAG: SDR family NAD(P)-dependent oxidoreductase [Bacteroidaceae bacterium]|nr:SDR family NAD(P)-dependent oxidoreductase [Bacteroidaceae bacterium]